MSVKSFKTSGVGVDLAPQGLVLINTTSFSAVASQSFTSIFSSTYDNYRVVVNVSAVSANDGNHFLRVRSGASDVTSNYIFSSWVKASNGTDISYNSGSATFIKLGAQDSASTAAQSYSFDIISPFLVQGTRVLANVSMQNDAGTWAGGVVTGYNFNATSYDGFTLHTENGTFTGTASVYGYNK
jgi:phosphoheptose isomerase